MYLDDIVPRKNINSWIKAVIGCNVPFKLIQSNGYVNQYIKQKNMLGLQDKQV